jgi:hypothetical protein
MDDLSAYKGINQFGRSYQIMLENDTHAKNSAWDVMNKNEDILSKDSSGNTLDIDFNQFSGIAISNYYINDHINYDYSVSGINQYYKGILEMSDKGWPGGIRWLHGEDSEK